MLHQTKHHNSLDLSAYLWYTLYWERAFTIMLERVLKQLDNVIKDFIDNIPDSDYLRGNVNFSVIARNIVKDAIKEEQKQKQTGWYQPYPDEENYLEPQDKQLYICIHKFGNHAPFVYQFRKADKHHPDADYFFDLAEHWMYEESLDSLHINEHWYPSFILPPVIDKFQPFNPPKEDYIRICNDIERWLTEYRAN